VSWDKRFGDPIAVPETAGHVRDVATYITKLPKAEHDADEWQAAMEALLLVVEHGGPPRCARIGIMRAINRHVEREFNSSRKDTHWKPRKLARDR
jgi:cob(I)alamin adenosyltransferase